MLLDVVNDTVEVAARASECSVSLLPVRESFEHRVLFDPTRRARLDVLHKIGQAHRGVEAGEKMQVILDAINAVKVSVAVSDDSPDIAEKFGAAVRAEDWGAVLGGKDDVISDRREG